MANEIEGIIEEATEQAKEISALGALNSLIGELLGPSSVLPDGSTVVKEAATTCGVVAVPSYITGGRIRTSDLRIQSATECPLSAMSKNSGTVPRRSLKFTGTNLFRSQTATKTATNRPLRADKKKAESSKLGSIR